jgi:hypothetical protein
VTYELRLSPGGFYQARHGFILTYVFRSFPVMSWEVGCCCGMMCQALNQALLPLIYICRS